MRGPKFMVTSPKASAIAPLSIAPVAVSPMRSNVSLTLGSSATSLASERDKDRGSSPRKPTTPSTAKPIPRLHPHDDHFEHRGRLDIWMLGITIVIGGQYFSWNAGVSAGFFSYLIAYVLVALAYIALCLCTAEITGALPFAGGAYGLSRCTLGFFPGFFIGCCEALEYIAYVATTTLFLADMIVSSAPGLHGYEPLIWLVFYVTALWFHIRGGRVFWGFNLVIGAVSILILLVFLFGSLPYVNFAKHTSPDSHIGFVGGFQGFLRVLPLATWFFVGVEALSLASDDVAEPRTVVPVAQALCVLTLAVTGVTTYFMSVSLPLGAGGLEGFSHILAPLNTGFMLMFHVSDTVATLLSIPATYATAFGFMWCYGKLIHAMATSRLLPPVLSMTSPVYGTPHIALIAGSVVSYVVCAIVYLVPVIGKYLFSICITSAFMAYTGQCIGYISLRKNYRNIKRSNFSSPFGIYGAVFSMVVWIGGLVSIAGFQGNGGVEILAFLGIAACVTVFYYAYAKKRQTFSPQENKVLLVAHVMKFNANRFHGKTKTKSGSRPTSRTTANRQHNNTNASSQAPSVYHSQAPELGQASNMSEGKASEHNSVVGFAAEE